MSLRIDMGWLIAALLVSVRVGTATALAPVFGPTQIPAMARVTLVLALSALIVSGVPLPELSYTTLAPLAVAMAGEALLGTLFAFGFAVAYAATQFAGRALDVQIGFGAAGILNPATRIMSPLMGSLLGMIAIAAFLALNGHLVLIKALALSLQALPPGGLSVDLDWAAVLRYCGVSFTFGLALAGPVMFMFLLSDLAMAVFARSMPQLNVFVLGFALKIVLGLLGLALSIRFADAVLGGLFDAVFVYWDRLITGN